METPRSQADITDEDLIAHADRFSPMLKALCELFKPALTEGCSFSFSRVNRDEGITIHLSANDGFDNERLAEIARQNGINLKVAPFYENMGRHFIVCEYEIFLSWEEMSRMMAWTSPQEGESPDDLSISTAMSRKCMSILKAARSRTRTTQYGVIFRDGYQYI